ncbi:ribosome recycling factor [Wenyingzhuangia heitensis]|uniref:Ribosome-recycling factor n=1 Tax=Wenyingzhuangia heitensis TaxID=1487859 RepID=A0ABX0U7I6_9FLAO|nr:ribosome recycling factor [Wenyingzhuangia heitensis]NIJ44809.1 ribosome recycling factor [Wenyingzhuangia heitensis]
MNEEVTFIIDTAKEGMDDAIAHLVKEFGNIRAGKASPAMLGSVMVDYYGSKTPLSQVANISTPDAQTITVQPWEKAMIPEIEKGILLSNLGFNPMNNGENIIINVPALTEERRKELSKTAKSEAEHAKISIRNIRRDANNDIKKVEVSDDEKKVAEDDIQNLTDKFIKKVDELYGVKDAEIMKV